MSFVDAYWWSNDGLRLHYRDYDGGGDGRPPIMCLPGLTRNARDFEALAAALAPGWRVLAVDFRGRGDSGYARDPLSYVPASYVQDVVALCTHLAVPRIVAISTSLGGIVTLLLAATGGVALAGVVLNDVGPALEPAGLARIAGQVGKAGSWPTWVHAGRALAEVNADVYPDYALNDWIAMAKRLYRLTSAGRVVPDYDAGIAAPLRVPGGDLAVDLWPTLDALVATPTLIVRGERSDILAPATVATMRERLPHAAAVTVPRVGHAPTLDEPAARAAIAALLACVVG